MRRLKDTHPEYADRVGVVAVNTDPLETVEEILSYKQAEGFSWPMTVAYPEVVRSYNVTRQAAYVAIDADGIVFSSVTYGRKDADDWRALFESLLGS